MQLVIKQSVQEKGYLEHLGLVRYNMSVNPQIFLLKKLKPNSMALVCMRTIPTERTSLVGEVSANFCR
jgi:hypothetical protein